MTVYRIQDPIRGDDQALFDDGVLDAAPVTQQVPICKMTEKQPEHCLVGVRQSLARDILKTGCSGVLPCRCPLSLWEPLCPYNRYASLDEVCTHTSGEMTRCRAGASSVTVLTSSAVQDIREADAVILGAPGRQGGMCGEMRMFLDNLAPLQVERKGGGFGALKVMSAHRAAPRPCASHVEHKGLQRGDHGRCSQGVFASGVRQERRPAGYFQLEVCMQGAVGQLQQHFLHIPGNAGMSSERGQQLGGNVCLCDAG